MKAIQPLTISFRVVGELWDEDGHELRLMNHEPDPVCDEFWSVSQFVSIPSLMISSTVVWKTAYL